MYFHTACAGEVWCTFIVSGPPAYPGITWHQPVQWRCSGLRGGADANCAHLWRYMYLPVTYLACVITKKGEKKEIVSNMCGRGQETKREWKRTGVFFRLLSNLVTSCINHQLSWLYVDILKKSAHIKAIFRISKSAHVSSNNANKTTEHKHTDIKCSYNRLKGTSKHR